MAPVPPPSRVSALPTYYVYGTGRCTGFFHPSPFHMYIWCELSKNRAFLAHVIDIVGKMTSSSRTERGAYTAARVGDARR